MIYLAPDANWDEVIAKLLRGEDHVRYYRSDLPVECRVPNTDLWVEFETSIEEIIDWFVKQGWNVTVQVCPADQQVEWEQYCVLVTQYADGVSKRLSTRSTDSCVHALELAMVKVVESEKDERDDKENETHAGGPSPPYTHGPGSP